MTYFRQFWVPLAIVLLTAVTRLVDIKGISITQDESTMLLFAKGVLERGYPFLHQKYGEFIISTYELVPYPLALSIGLLGFSEFSARLPAVLFSVGTVLLILRFGTVLFDRRAGVLAAVLFAVLPWAIYWGQNAFYPSQVQFFALLTTMIIHRLIVETRPARWVYYAIFGSFGLTYLSWEGSGVLLPVFFAMILMMRWGKWQWMSSVHGWIAASLMILLVVGQLTYRTLLREPYLGIVSGRSELQFAELAFTKVNFDPFFYIEGLNSESHVVLAFFLVVGILFLHRSWSLRFLYLFAGLYVLLLTTFLGYYALRYVYLALPAILMAVAGVTVMLADRLSTSTDLRDGRFGRNAFFSLLAALHFSVASPWGLQPMGLAERYKSLRSNELKSSLRGFSFRAMARELMSRYQKGDVIIVQAPFPFQLYTGMEGDYMLQGISATSTFYVPTGPQFYTDKWVGNPVLRNQSELDEVMMRNRRVWFVSAPDEATKGVVGREMYDSLTRRSKIVAESVDGRLYLWNNPGM